jgi:hypothetical protein
MIVSAPVLAIMSVTPMIVEADPSLPNALWSARLMVKVIGGPPLEK